MNQPVNLSDWKLTRKELLLCAMAYVWQFTCTSEGDKKRFLLMLGTERVDKFSRTLKEELGSRKRPFNPVEAGWELGDIFMALQDELDRELSKEVDS